LALIAERSYWLGSITVGGRRMAAVRRLNLPTHARHSVSVSVLCRKWQLPGWTTSSQE